jgi:hypothetical protein
MHFEAPDALLKKLADDPAFIASGVSAASHYRADISAAHILEGYYPRLRAEELAYRYALDSVPEARANLIIHGVDQPIAVKRNVMPLAVVAADLIASQDSRTRRAGEKLLSRLQP